MVTLNASTKKTQTISIEKLAKMTASERNEVSVVKILPPTLTSKNDFGNILIRDKHPTYEVEF